MKKLVPPMQFIPLVSPRYKEPHHLARLVDVFERIARGEEVHAVFSVHPRSEKTETAAHCIVWLLKQRPELRVCYCMYGQRIAAKKSKRIRAIAERAHVPLDRDAASKADWRTGVDEGGLWATSESGASVGEGFDLIIGDDLVKDRVSAESALARERTHEWWLDTMYPRLEPGGSSLVMMHRWHVDDIAGRLVRDGYEEINLPAINEQGEALLPSRYPISALNKIRDRIGDYAWESLYMGQPRPRGGRVFQDVHTYDPTKTEIQYMPKFIGLDFAYSIKTHADYSVAVVLAFDGANFYIVDVVRVQMTAPSFQAEIEKLRLSYPNARLVAYVSGTERGTIDMMISQGLPIDARPAIGDKFTRSIPTAASWNAGRVRIPEEVKTQKLAWREAFVNELAGFTGVKDKRDDQVDALAAAHDAAKDSVSNTLEFDDIDPDLHFSRIPTDCGTSMFD